MQEMNINISNYKRIQQMESEKDITILHGGLGGVQRYTVSLNTYIYDPPSVAFKYM